MGSLTKGKYTYGNMTYTNIKTITTAKVGDTVFDTTLSKRRIYDGNNFVDGASISLPYSTTETLNVGGTLVPDASADNKVRQHNSSTFTEIIIGTIEDKKNSTANDVIALCYFGFTYIAVTAGAGSNSCDPGDFIQLSTASAGLFVSQLTGASGAALTTGIWLSPSVTTATIGFGLFRPVERY